MACCDPSTNEQRERPLASVYSLPGPLMPHAPTYWCFPCMNTCPSALNATNVPCTWRCRVAGSCEVAAWGLAAVLIKKAPIRPHRCLFPRPIVRQRRCAVHGRCAHIAAAPAPHSQTMQNDEGRNVDLYIPRKWCVLHWQSGNGWHSQPAACNCAAAFCSPDVHRAFCVRGAPALLRLPARQSLDAARGPTACWRPRTTPLCRCGMRPRLHPAQPP